MNASKTIQIQFDPWVSYLSGLNEDTNAEVLDFLQIDSNDKSDRNNFKAPDNEIAAGISFDLKPLIIGVYSSWARSFFKERKTNLHASCR